MKKILVLGANGFLGSHFCKIINKNIYNIFPMARYGSNTDRFRTLNNLKLIRYNGLEDLKKIIFIIKKNKINIIVNFAAHGVQFDKKNTNYIPFNKANYFDVKNLLKSCSSENIERYIHIGTVSEFGKQKIAINDKL